jgi:16S rRNA (guanine527-N7)-methyltransferase
VQQESMELLRRGLEAFGISAGEENLQAVARHLAMVAEWNERVNLTAITDEREMVLKHAVDSATALACVPLRPGQRVLDVGTGAGFPGVTLKCLVPEIELVLLESLAKRCKFLEAVGTEVMASLDGRPNGYQVVWGRAEEMGQKPGFRESFDLVTARAVAELRVLCEYCLPFCKVDGSFLALKGPGVESELSLAANAIAKLGGEVAEVREVELPEGVGKRTLVLIRKVRPTPKAYPRKPGTPAKNPL